MMVMMAEAGPYWRRPKRQDDSACDALHSASSLPGLGARRALNDNGRLHQHRRMGLQKTRRGTVGHVLEPTLQVRCPLLSENCPSVLAFSRAPWPIKSSVATFIQRARHCP